MTLNLLDQIGNWNPQLFREIKGRWKMGNMAIASAFSLGPQLLLFMYYMAQLPVALRNTKGAEPIYNRFCVLKTTDNTKSGEKCLTDTLGNLVIDWPKWSVEIFTWLSISSVLVLLVAGTYMLVSDLDKEERRGTLNFIRLSPQSANTIFLGKVLGVPILLYLAAILVIPLHLYTGLTAQIPLPEILGFYMAIAASCALFYSAAMLFGLTTSWLGGFQPWLASGIALFVFIISTIKLTVTAGDLGTFVSSIGILRYLIFGIITDKYAFGSLGIGIDKLQWFYLPIGKNIVSGMILSLSICGIGTYWMWQGWQRRFPNPTTTVFSKRQSYFAVICCQPIILGFALQTNSIGNGEKIPLLILNLVMFLIVIASLTSDRQSLYDWARYRQQIVPSGQKLWRRYPLLDLIWSEKSPAIVAIAINLLSSSLIVIGAVMFIPETMQGFNTNLFWDVVIGMNLILIYAAITQLFLFLKTRNQEIWAVGTICGAILLPPVILSMLLLTSDKYPVFWLSSTFPIFWTSSAYMGSGTTILLSIIGQWIVLVMLNLKLRSQLKLAGESASKALLKA